MGTRLGDDYALGARPLADRGCHGVRRALDRGSQSRRLGEIGEPALGHSAFTWLRLEYAGACGVCGVSAHPLDWRYRGGVQSRTGLWLGHRAPACISAASWADTE